MILGFYKRTEKRGIKSTKILQVWNVCKGVLVPSQRVLHNGLQNKTSLWFHDVRAPQRTFIMKQKPVNLEVTCKALSTLRWRNLKTVTLKTRQIVSIHTTPKTFKTQQSWFISELSLRKTRVGNSPNYRHLIISEKLRFGDGLVWRISVTD